MENTTTLAEPVAAVTAYLDVAGIGSAASTVVPLHDEILIGRDQQDSLALEKFLCIPEHTVSRRHARIRRRGAIYYIEDLDSFNGTFVLGKRVSPGTWHPLRDGDELHISHVPMVFHSLLIPQRDSQPSKIAQAIDATEYAKTLAAPLDVAQDDKQLIVQKLHAMAQVGIALGAVTDRATLVEKIMQFIFDLFPLAERALILISEKEGERPVPVAARRRDGSVEDPRQVRMSRTIMDAVLNKKQSILSLDTLADRHYGEQESIVSQAIRSVMCVPLLLESECLGLIQIDTSSCSDAFNTQDLEMLTGVCAETAIALKNFQLYSDIERLLDGFVRASVQAIEERDPVTAGHSFRVATYAEQLAIAVDRTTSPELRDIGFTKEQLREIRYAALLHDFGKVGVREHVLGKEKKLHRAELHLLEQRFQTARVCLERQAYRELAELHVRQEFSMAAFRKEKQRIDDDLRAEFARLDTFLVTIRRANEPAISDNGDTPALTELLHYAIPDIDGIPLRLLDEDEFSALNIAKGCLTFSERQEIQAHVSDSYAFLILIPWTRDLAGVPAIAHGHHEKLDGSGYPMGLRGNQISVQTRMLTICDIYDALTAGDRPYKKAVSVEQALALMAAECRAGWLDTGLFSVFVESKAWLAT